MLLQKSALLVLDNVWNERAVFHVLKAVPPGMPVMITSRQRFPAGPILDVSELAPDDALTLLGHHAAGHSIRQILTRRVCADG